MSLTFDDGRQTQYAARAPLAAHGMHATFYVNSGWVASTTSDYHMKWGQLHDLASDGNEIAGHSVTHAHLTTLSPSDLRHEVCDDRTALLNHGFSPVISFAYPYTEYNSAVESVVQQCGYRSARWVDGIRSSSCMHCPFAETIPPLDPWVIRTPPDIDTATTLATMESYVTQAENNGGGWVVIVIHSVCTGCDSVYAVTLSQLTAFLDWLQPRAANGTVVQTVGQVVSGAGPPSPPPPVMDTPPPVTDTPPPVTETPPPVTDTPPSVTDTPPSVTDTPPPVTDGTPPVTTISCNGTGCSKGGYRSSAVTVRLSAADAGSGVASTRYTTDGTTPSATHGTTYAGVFRVRPPPCRPARRASGHRRAPGRRCASRRRGSRLATMTVKFYSADYAGNKEAVRSTHITIRR
ncbi:MAG: polysaccharide deacetylase [Solirubrobacterales bacterium]|nr:polysaccharide deacetylase [Solirubrobacterales bacterium]